MPSARDIPKAYAPACTFKVLNEESGAMRPCKGRGRKVVVIEGFEGEIACGPLCSAHFRSVYAHHGHLVKRVEYIDDANDRNVVKEVVRDTPVDELAGTPLGGMAA